MYKISITNRAEKDLRKSDRPTKNRIIEAITNLADEPRPPRLPENSKRRRRLANPRRRLAHRLPDK
jgi:mRNA-degrading endonuclease RelE of RelBE toxin-antitoxin system